MDAESCKNDVELINFHKDDTSLWQTQNEEVIPDQSQLFPPICLFYFMGLIYDLPTFLTILF